MRHKGGKDQIRVLVWPAALLPRALRQFFTRGSSRIRRSRWTRCGPRRRPTAGRPRISRLHLRCPRLHSSGSRTRRRRTTNSAALSRGIAIPFICGASYLAPSLSRPLGCLRAGRGGVCAEMAIFGGLWQFLDKRHT